MTRRGETFHFNPPFHFKENWMLGLTSLEVYNSIFNITEENNNFKLYKFPVEKSGGLSYEKVGDEIERLGYFGYYSHRFTRWYNSPIFIKEYRKQVTERMKDVGYMNILAGYIRSISQDFESYLRTEVDLAEDDIRLVLDEYNSSFITYESEPGFYIFKDLSKVLFNMLQSEYPGPSKVVDIESDDITMKTKLIVKRGIIAIRFDENRFLVLSSVLLQVAIINTIMNRSARKL